MIIFFKKHTHSVSPLDFLDFISLAAVAHRTFSLTISFKDFIQKICRLLSKSSPQNPIMLSVLNAQNLAGNTPLHWAALNGHLEAVQALIEQGADPTITNKMGHDAIYEAELNDQKDVVEWVLKEGGKDLDQAISKERIEENPTCKNSETVVSDDDPEHIHSGLEQISLETIETSYNISENKFI